MIELKRGRSSDKALGQLLRYMGWVKRHLAGANESVKGMIIGRTIDKTLKYAVEGLGSDDVMLMEYEVYFELKEPSHVQLEDGEQ